MVTAVKPRVVIDARMVGPTIHGIARYVTLLAHGLSGLKDLPYEPVFLVAPGMKMADFRVKETNVAFLSPGELWSIPRLLSELGASLYHSPSFSSLFYCPCPWVSTVHDLNHLSFGHIGNKIYYRALLRPFALKAKELLTVSEFSRREIAAWLGIPRDSIDVVYNALDPAFATPPSTAEIDAVLKGLRLERGKYFFCLSNPKPHKNLNMLERAYAQALEQRSLPPLVLSIPGNGTRGVVRTGPLHDEEVGALLRNAKAFFFPSLYEGFGRPPVEAALAGTVPVVSSISVHREALAGVSEAVFLDPAAEPLWVESFLRMATLSERVGERSKAWIRDTWSIERLAKAMDRAYRDCLEK